MLTLLKRIALSSFVIGTLLSTSSGQEEQPELPLEGERFNDLTNWLSPISGGNETRFSWDLSVRGIQKVGAPQTDLLSAVGLDLHHVFSSSTGRDLGTLRLQGYALRADFPKNPPLFGDNHWEWTDRIADFNYTRFSAKGVNVRLGHYQVPYGLEQTQSTYGTLRDYMSRTNLGIKADWGVTLNGQLPDYEYEVSLSRGSGQNYKDLEENYVFAGRLGTPREENLCVGTSFMSGRLPDVGPVGFVDLGDLGNFGGNFINKHRFGLDAIWSLPVVTVLSEVNFGENDATNVASAMLEVNCTSSNENELAYVQLFGSDDQEKGDEYWATLGGLVHLGGGVTLSAQYKVDLDAWRAPDRSETFMLQLRYRF